MRWPWRKRAQQERMAISWSAGTLAYVRAQVGAGVPLQLRQMGVERQGDDSDAHFVARLQRLGLQGQYVQVMLRPQQYQLLQIEAPPVPADELRLATRFQVRDMIDAHLDDVTLDVLRVGDGKRSNALFVVVATHAVLRDVMALGAALHWTVDVIDIQELAQRNLQSHLAPAQAQRAEAALMLADDKQVMLTICAQGELFYARRLELPQGLQAQPQGALPGHSEPASDFPSGLLVPEYLPSQLPADAAGADDEGNQRFLIDVQRSLDLWDRTWPDLPLASLRLGFGARSAEYAAWLQREIGQTVVPLDLADAFPVQSDLPFADRTLCLALIGQLLRGDAVAP